MRTAIFGGSFNPVHLGHIALAEYVLGCGYQRILFVPARFPPHKDVVEGASDDDRLAMLQSAVKEEPWARVWPGELEREGPSYSIDTVEELIDKGLVPMGPGFIIGDDLITGFPLWKEAGRLAASTEILLARRSVEGGGIRFPHPHRRLGNPIWPHSSSAVRMLIAEGGPLNSVVPDIVAAHIRDRGLYGIAG